MSRDCPSWSFIPSLVVSVCEREWGGIVGQAEGQRGLAMCGALSCEL